MEELILLFKQWLVRRKIQQRPTISKLVNTSKVVTLGAVIVDNIFIAGDGVNADAQVYDGPNTHGEKKIHMETLSGTSSQWGPQKNNIFRNGIYVVVNAATTFVTVTYKTINNEEIKILEGHE